MPGGSLVSRRSRCPIVVVHLLRRRRDAGLVFSSVNIDEKALESVCKTNKIYSIEKGVFYLSTVVLQQVCDSACVRSFVRVRACSSI